MGDVTVYHDGSMEVFDDFNEAFDYAQQLVYGNSEHPKAYVVSRIERSNDNYIYSCTWIGGLSFCIEVYM